MMTILLIEDDLADQQIFRRFLNKADLETNLVTCNSIAKAVELIDDNEIDLIFCDFNLPDGTAIDFFKKKKRR